MVSGAKRSRQADFRRLLFALALVAYCLCSLRYILATSVVEEGQRWFVLWDDAMISMQYARNLAYGHGLVWNVGGEPVQGFTNLGITLFMAFLHGLAIPLPYVSLVDATKTWPLPRCRALSRTLYVPSMLVRMYASGET